MSEPGEVERLRGENTVLAHDVETLRRRLTELQVLLADQVTAALRAQVINSADLIELMNQARAWERAETDQAAAAQLVRTNRTAADQLVRTDAMEARLRGDSHGRRAGDHGHPEV